MTIIAGALIAGLLGAGLAPQAQADWSGKPLLSGMKNENDIVVQHVREALTAFESVNKHWPATLDELMAFSQPRRIPLDLTAFDQTNYYVQSQGGATVAVFEFVLKGGTAKGAFAMANYVVAK
jgi:hypothetical protein